MSVTSTLNPEGTERTILSIDGGGMRGAIPEVMLIELERITGTPCHQPC
jgi:patatin-like phospholipase/acyl hydrolase